MKQRAFYAPAFVAFAAICCCLFACNNLEQPEKIIRAGYYWKNRYGYFSGDDSEVTSFLDTHKINKVYIKMLDVDWNPVNHAFPVSKTDLYPYQKDTIEYIPVAYITNYTMLKTDSAEIPRLAMRIIRHLLKIERTTHRYCKEIQLDCDWTEQTKDKYFYLLKEIKNLRPTYTLSVTLRLYQYKYHEKTGVPPADRAMLMLYNFENSRNYNNDNNIFEKNEAEKYLIPGKKYPLPLDYALPAFSWSVVFRNKEYLGMLNNYRDVHANANSIFEPAAKNVYVFKRDTVIGDVYVRAGDELKTETCNAATLAEAKEIALQTINNKTPVFAIFHLAAENLNYYKHEEIEMVFDTN